MKRFFAVLMILVVLISICGCSKTSVNKNADVSLSFVYGEDMEYIHSLFEKYGGYFPCV